MVYRRRRDGDPANVANRVEEMGHQIGRRDDQVNILVSGEVRGAPTGDYQFESLGEQDLRGRSRRIEMFSLLGESG